MASMISGDLAVAYVLKNASEEKKKSAEAAAAQGKEPQKAGDGPSGKKTAEEAEAGGKSDGSGFIGFQQEGAPRSWGSQSFFLS